MPTPLQDFIRGAREQSRRFAEPAECVEAIAPLMHELLTHVDSFLEPRHLGSDPDHYARNAILVSPDESLSLYALVWLPGQWTPVHDHGSWGVVGIVQGMLQERSYIRLDANRSADDGIELVRGGVLLLTPGTVSSFVPNPDQIHVTGVANDGAMTISLHLYGRNMNNFCVYDLAARSRKRINVPHNES